MLSLLYVISALALGTAITKRLGLKFIFFETPALSITFGFLIWTWLSFLLALLLPHNLSLPLTVILAAIATFLLFKSSSSWQWRPLVGGPLAWLSWGIFTLITTTMLGWLMWTHDLISRPDGLYSSSATWADFGLHASLINHFAQSPRLPLDFPLAAGTHLTYPLIVDLLSGWLVTGGLSLHLAIFIPSILLVTAFLQLMLGFGVRLFRSIGGMIGGLSLTLLCGSAAGIFQALTDYYTSHQTFGAFLANLPMDYSGLAHPNAQFTNLVADILLPQRAFLMGFAVFGAVAVLFTHLHTHHHLKLAVFTGAVIGLMPLTHPHSFVVIMALVAALWCEAWIKNRRFLNTWVAVGGSALIVAAPQILWETLANRTGTGGHLALGWIIAPGESLIPFWTHNYGLTLPLIVLVAALLIFQKSLRHYLVWYAPLVLIFIFANIYALQPFAYDNQKLMLYTYLFTYILASYGSLWLIRRHHSLVVPVGLIALLLASSGALAITREFEHSDQFASSDDIALAAWTKQNTSPSDIFLTTDRPNQPIAALAGRELVAGYRGWLYNYNLAYQPRLDIIQEALIGDLTSDNPYHAHYLAVAPSEPTSWEVDPDALDAHYQLLYSNPSWKIYRLP